ncbi:MAG TPA: hypothetical protein VNI83_06980 [Vicinamibacterales bacterium]|nr:hypothetical protein [Vicinamibacterales bacterium]
MDAGLRTPLVDLFRRGEASREAKLLAARGGFAPRALEQLALLLLLADDGDPEVASAARATIDALPADRLRGLLARSDVPPEVRAFFAARGIEPAAQPAEEGEAPLIDATDAADAGAPAGGAEPERLQVSALPVTEKLKLAVKGTREQRAVLVRDPNRIVAVAVLSSPKLTESEIESFARMANVTDEVLRIIGTNRQWTHHYAVVAALVRNPKTPPAVSLNLINRLAERDIKALSIDRNVPEALRLAARKYLAKAAGR